MMPRKGHKMSVTIYDVAKHTNISTCWVSWTLRNHPRSLELRPETRERIRQAAQKLGYRPKTSAATIKKGFNPSTVALVLNQEGPISGLQHIIQYLNTLGYGARVYFDNLLEEAFNDIMDNQIHYVFSTSYWSDRRAQLSDFCSKNGLRAVFASSGEPLPHPAFQTDNEGMFVEMVHRLYALGHRKIALCCGPHTHNSTILRHAGYRRGLAECGLSYGDELTLCEDFSAEHVLSFVRKNPVTAFCCIDGLVALKLEHILIRHGVRIPQDISLIAACGSQQEAEAALVPITFFSAPGFCLVDDALDYLLERRSHFPFDETNCLVYPSVYHEEESLAVPRKHRKLELKPDLFR